MTESSLRQTYPALARTELASFLPKDAKTFLDVGCGRGGFAPTIRSVAPKAFITGIEVLPEQAAEAIDVMDEVIVGEIPAALDQFGGRSFDCIILNDILEHLVDPWATLTRFKELSHPGTMIISSIPNVQFLQVTLNLLLRGRWDYADAGILDRTHLRFFTRKSIEEMFVQCDFRVESIQGINSQFGRRWLARSLMRLMRDGRWLQFAVVARPNVTMEPASTD
jgi:2-polyprenyl-3-methyl-5-hydroxy-6-metoxy-1,4-benzoquinol methylase